MNLIKKATFLSIAWFIGLIAVLIFSEIALRVIYYGDKPIIPSQVVSELGLQVEYQREYDVSRFYDTKENIVNYKRDKFGLRNSCGSHSNIDILTVGGSTTEQQFVKNESTFQAVIEDLILENMGKDVCIANAGVGGHSTYGHIRSFEDWFPLLPDLAPKYVMLYVGVNDAFLDRDYTQTFGGKRKPKRLIKKFIRKTYLSQKTRPFFNYINNIIDKDTVRHGNYSYYSSADYTITALQADTISKVESRIGHFRVRFQKNLDYVAEMGAQPICVTQPHISAKTIDGQRRGLPNRPTFGLDYDYFMQEIYKVMYKLCGIDNSIDMYSVDFPKGSFYDTVHTTDIGSKFLGERMFEAMKQKGMLEIF